MSCHGFYPSLKEEAFKYNISMKVIILFVPIHLNKLLEYHIKALNIYLSFNNFNYIMKQKQ